MIDEPLAGSDTDIALLVDRLLRRVHARLHLRAVAVDSDRIGPFGGMVLLTLFEIEPAPIHELVRHMARDKSQMTRTLAALDAKGLIRRARSEEDARVWVLRLTAKGREQVASFRTVIAEAVDEVLLPLEPAERAALKDLLSRALV